VSAGEAAIVLRNTVQKRIVPPDDITRKLAWTAGHLVFQGETLNEAVQEFNRYNQRKLAIADQTIVQQVVGGDFTATDPDSFVAALWKLFGIQARADKTNGTIRLSAGGKPPP
jgi:transmembrane sensor